MTRPYMPLYSVFFRPIPRFSITPRPAHSGPTPPTPSPFIHPILPPRPSQSDTVPAVSPEFRRCAVRSAAASDGTRHARSRILAGRAPPPRGLPAAPARGSPAVAAADPRNSLERDDGAAGGVTDSPRSGDAG